MWHQVFNGNFTKLRECFLCAKKTIITLFIQQVFSPSLPPFSSTPERNQPNQRCLCSACAKVLQVWNNMRVSSLINDSILIFEWTNPLIYYLCSTEERKSVTQVWDDIKGHVLCEIYCCLNINVCWQCVY